VHASVVLKCLPTMSSAALLFMQQEALERILVLAAGGGVARIPEAEIERLKDQVSLISLTEAAGVVLRKTGDDLTGCCPFHEDDTPSLVISPGKNLWHCLGACQAGGSVIDWVMRAEGVSFRHAVELLRDGMPAITPAGRAPGRSTVRRLASPLNRDAADDELLGQVTGYYRRVLQESPDALGYLARRKIDHPEVIDTFCLGYADRTLGLRLPDKRRKDGADIRGRLTRLGIYRASGHEHFAGSLVIPVHDEHGNMAEVYGRKIRDDLRAGTPAHLYLPGPHRGVWNLAALAASDEIIVCESLIDALTFWCAGFRHVTASFGAGGFTADHQRAFAEHQVRRALIAYDRDDAGVVPAARGRPAVLAHRPVPPGPARHRRAVASGTAVHQPEPRRGQRDEHRRMLRHGLGDAVPAAQPGDHHLERVALIQPRARRAHLLPPVPARHLQDPSGQLAGVHDPDHLPGHRVALGKPAGHADRPAALPGRVLVRAQQAKPAHLQVCHRRIPRGFRGTRQQPCAAGRPQGTEARRWREKRSFSDENGLADLAASLPVNGRPLPARNPCSDAPQRAVPPVTGAADALRHP